MGPAPDDGGSWGQPSRAPPALPPPPPPPPLLTLLLPPVYLNEKVLLPLLPPLVVLTLEVVLVVVSLVMNFLLLLLLVLSLLDDDDEVLRLTLPLSAPPLPAAPLAALLGSLSPPLRVLPPLPPSGLRPFGHPPPATEANSPTPLPAI